MKGELFMFNSICYNIISFILLLLILLFFIYVLIKKYSNYNKKENSNIYENDLNKIKKLYISQSIVLYLILFVFLNNFLYIKDLSILFFNNLNINYNLLLLFQIIIFIIILFFTFKKIILKEQKELLQYLGISETFKKRNILYGFGFILLFLLIGLILFYVKKSDSDFIIINFNKKDFLFLILIFLYASFFEEYYFRYYIIYKQIKYFEKKDKYNLVNYELKNISIYSSIYAILHIIYIIKNPFYLILIFVFSMFMYWYKTKSKSIIYSFLLHLIKNILTYIFIIKLF